MMIKQSESPIETDLLATILAFNPPVSPMKGANLNEMIEAAWQVEEKGKVSAAPQVVIGRYRADIVLVGSSPPRLPPVVVCVECDGSEWHGSREQMMRDLKRDHDMQSKGIIVARFTGRQIWRDPYKCARQAIELALRENIDGLSMLGLLKKSLLAGEWIDENERMTGEQE